MISTSIVYIVDWLAVTHDKLSSRKAPAAILDQVSRSQTVPDQIKSELKLRKNSKFQTHQSSKLPKLLKALLVCVTQVKSLAGQ